MPKSFQMACSPFTETKFGMPNMGLKEP